MWKIIHSLMIQNSFYIKDTCAVSLCAQPPDGHAVTFPPCEGDES